MRRIFHFSVLCLAAGLVNACKTEATVVPTQAIPSAGVRFINAVPDSGGGFGLILRFVDIVESNVQFRITFRNGPQTSGTIIASTQTEYKPAQAGSRHFVIFLDDSSQAVASVKLVDTTVTLEAGKNYTALLWGAARPGGTPPMKFTFYEEAVPDPLTQVALRVINTTASAIDVTQYVKGAAVPATPTWAAVPAQSISAYVLTAPALINFNVKPAGGGAVLFPDVQALPGNAAASTAGSTTLDTPATPGTNVAGSAVTMLVFPRSVAGSKTPQSAAFLLPAGTFIWDRRPPQGF